MFPTETVDNVETLLFAVVVLGILLLAGTLIRIVARPIRRLFLPAALIGGAVGLAFGPYGAGLFPESLIETWSGLPGVLATIVFAPMLMGVRIPKVRETYRMIVPQLLFGYMGAFLMIGVPLVVSALVLMPLWDVDRMFGTLVDVGWPGGHGTAGAMAEVYQEHGWSAGVSLGLTSATVGLVFGITVGMALVNWGVSRGHVTAFGPASETADDRSSDILPESRRTPIGRTAFNKDLVDSLTFHVTLVAVAVLIGWVLQYFIELVVPGMPLFPLAMIGGGIVQAVIGRTPLRGTVDAASLRTIQAVALDLLIVSAVASIHLPLVIDNAGALAVLMVLAAGLAIGFFFLAGPRLFQQNWFEQAIVNFGSLTGVSSVGLMLLRTVDPDLSTITGKAYALSKPFRSPFIGGGLITALVPILAFTRGPLLTGAIFIALFLILLLAARLLGFWRKPAKAARVASSV
ncbi:sodium/glutamate symporter [Amycolatopsis palatopharyngis]|uniref:sodium/glutamate symporter n=1 Tax=Amycolatopsis palatopharyngis TaxID=187982 RepID=UPI000E23DE8E|nr:sodium/glutamate symporter [Amycolatopsis palatopharyngis]